MSASSAVDASFFINALENDRSDDLKKGLEHIPNWEKDLCPDGNHLLHLTITYGAVQCLEFVVQTMQQKGMSVEVKNKENKTPLEVTDENIKLAQSLMQIYETIPNYRENLGIYRLHQIAQLNFKTNQMCRDLLLNAQKKYSEEKLSIRKASGCLTLIAWEFHLLKQNKKYSDAASSSKVNDASSSAASASCTR